MIMMKEMEVIFWWKNQIPPLREAAKTLIFRKHEEKRETAHDLKHTTWSVKHSGGYGIAMYSCQWNQEIVFIDDMTADRSSQIILRCIGLHSLPKDTLAFILEQHEIKPDTFQLLADLPSGL